MALAPLFFHFNAVNAAFFSGTMALVALLSLYNSVNAAVFLVKRR